MKIKFFFLITFLCAVSVGTTADNSLEKYLNKFNNRYSLSKEITSEDDLPYRDADANLIDTTFLLKYKLVDINWGTESSHYPKLDGYRCEHISHFKTKIGILVISKSLQSSAGSGNPTLTLSSIGRNGNLIDMVRFDWEYENQEGIEEKNTFAISTDFIIKHEQIRTDYKFQNEKRVIIETTTVSRIYSLTEDGHFKRKEKK
jgi:hypothetical protein